MHAKAGLLAIAVALSSGTATSGADLNALQRDMIQCAVFNATAVVAFENADSPSRDAAVQTANENTDFFLEQALAVGRRIGQSDDGFQARVRIFNKTTLAEIDNNIANFSILLGRYAEYCGALKREISKRLDANAR